VSAALLRFPVERVRRPDPRARLVLRELRLNWREKIVAARRYAAILRLATDDESRWFWACRMVNYRGMARDVAAYIDGLGT
jgi:hypothetical protein